MRTRYGRMVKQGKSGQAPSKMTARQRWLWQTFGFLRDHIVTSSGRASAQVWYLKSLYTYFQSFSKISALGHKILLLFIVFVFFCFCINFTVEVINALLCLIQFSSLFFIISIQTRIKFKAECIKELLLL